MTRLLSAVAVLLVVIATPPIHAGQAISIARVPGITTPPAGDVTVPSVKAAAEKLTASTVIKGNALDSANGQLANVPVRLRDARFGRVVETQYTDQSGMFAFKSIQPGTYIVEILGNDESILAASQLLNVNAGEAVLAVVKLPFNVAQAAGLSADTMTTRTAALLVLQAAATGITALVPTSPISPNQ
jgi:hypothetical protein